MTQSSASRILPFCFCWQSIPIAGRYCGTKHRLCCAVRACITSIQICTVDCIVTLRHLIGKICCHMPVYIIRRMLCSDSVRRTMICRIIAHQINKHPLSDFRGQHHQIFGHTVPSKSIRTRTHSNHFCTRKPTQIQTFLVGIWTTRLQHIDHSRARRTQLTIRSRCHTGPCFTTLNLRT